MLVAVPAALDIAAPIRIVGALTYYFTNTASDVASELQQTTGTYTPKTTQTFAALGSGTTALETFITNAGNPGLTFLPLGNYNVHIHISQSAGTRSMTVYAEIWEATSLGADIAKIGTTGQTPAIGGTEAEYDVGFALGSNYILSSTASRIKTKIFTIGGGVGSNATLLIYVGDEADSHTTLPGPQADVTNFVPYTGAIKSVNLGPNTITAQGATLTNPLTVPNGGTGVATLTGVLIGNGASNISASTVTQYDVLVGGASNTISSVGPGTAGQILQSGGNAANPAYSTPTYPSTSGTAGKVVISDGTNNVYSTPTFPNASATSGKIIISDGTNWIASTPTYPNTSGSAGVILRSDGTNNVYTTAAYPNTAGTSGNVLTSDGTNWISSSTPSSVIYSVVVQVFTSTGANTYTPTAGMKFCTIEVVGGGGGSGGCATTGGGQISCSGGGGGGGYARKTVTAATIGVSQTATVGTGGLAGTAGSNTGGTGVTSSLGAIVTASGGAGGGGGIPTGGGLQAAAGGGTGGIGSSGDFNVRGSAGGTAWSINNTVLTTIAGFGGSSHLGGGTTNIIGATAPTAGNNYGGGAGGGALGPSTGQIAGAAGAQGIVIITEYI